ncbi:MAG: LPS export ABC transporter periplasmic protein LptC [Gemmobacter sp.]
MARGGGAYSRIVGALKLGLVLGGLALLSTVFLLSRGREPGDVLPYSEADLDALLREPRMTAPEYTGLTRDGAAIRLTAGMAQTLPDATGGGGRAAEPRLLLVTEGGGRTEARAAEARIDRNRGVLVLSGDALIETSSGWRVESATLVAALDRTRVESPAPVVGSGPPGRIEAGAMVIERPDRDRAEVLVFKDGVRLLYRPGHSDP